MKIYWNPETTEIQGLIVLKTKQLRLIIQDMSFQEIRNIPLYKLLFGIMVVGCIGA